MSDHDLDQKPEGHFYCAKCGVYFVSTGEHAQFVRAENAEQLLKMAMEELEKHSQCNVIHQGRIAGLTCRQARERILNGTDKATDTWLEINRSNPARVLCAACQMAETLAAIRKEMPENA